ncbi:MAG: ribulose kinase, partial [Phycisphaerales bacterium]|nr:ribulose kinase [Phycisphaerales bacterium]
MSIVAGVDFGTRSVRVSVVDSGRGPLGAGTAAYPLHRRADDPGHASQRHADHMAALCDATARALAAARVDGRRVEAIAVATTG